MSDEEVGDVICCNCVDDPYLKEKIATEGDERECSYCGETGSTFTLDEMADIIEVAFEQHFQRTADEPDTYQSMAMSDRESSYDWERDGDPTIIAIENAAQISGAAARDIQEILDGRHGDMDSAMAGYETEFSEETHYEEITPGDSEWESGWREFVRSLQSEARFFSRVASTQLAALFDGVDRLSTRDGRPIIVDAGPGTEFTHLFRARVFQSDGALLGALKRPDQQLSAPPSRMAGSGRMNAKGISTFYGATDPRIAIAEVRPPVGSQVALARFDIIRPLRLLDLSALQAIRIAGSIFDPTYAAALGRMMFLRKLSGRISRPVMPDDQDVEYLPTQAVADYLATESAAPLDGILFSSVQADGEGLNAVLFHKASRCEEMDIPRGTSISAQTGQYYEEGWEQDYSVFERVPAPAEPATATPRSGGVDLDETFDWPRPDDDYRQPALRIVPTSVRVHTVNSVVFETTDMPVTRHRSVRRAADQF